MTIKEALQQNKLKVGMRVEVTYGEGDVDPWIGKVQAIREGDRFPIKLDSRRVPCNEIWDVKILDKPDLQPGDLVRILDVPDSEYEEIGHNSFMKAMVGKVCEVEEKSSRAGYWRVYTPDKSTWWSFPQSALEKVDEVEMKKAVERGQELSKLIREFASSTTEELNIEHFAGIRREVMSYEDAREQYGHWDINKQTKPKTMLRTISDRLARALNADKKAMYELSWIDESLEPTSLAIEQLHDILFDLHEKELGERAKAEVKRIKEEAKKK